MGVWGVAVKGKREKERKKERKGQSKRIEGTEKKLKK